ncbi:unnamed protein product, partial [Staurois parvus]
MQGPGRPDIVNAGSGETGYSECRVQGNGYSECKGPGKPDIVNAGSGMISAFPCRQSHSYQLGCSSCTDT